MTDASSAPSATPSSSLVGRDRELAALRDALASALAGRGSLVLIGGEAGIGKTALAEATLAEAQTQGALALVGRCYDLAETPPYGPWTEALDHAPVGDDLPILPATVLPPERTGVALAGPDAIVRRVRDYLAALSARQPTILLLDDLHWADPASLDLLRFLARSLAGMPLLLLATYRAEEVGRTRPLHTLLPLLVREARAERLDLRPLEEPSIAELVAARYALDPPERGRLVGYLTGRSEGNALFLGELLRTLESEGTLHRAGTRWILGDLEQTPVPTVLRQVIEGRLHQLDRETERLLAVAAVIGQVVPFAVWAAVGDVAEGDLLDHAERAITARLLAETPDGSGVRFAHALIREALYEATSALRRRALHRRVGEALATAPRPDPDAVAYHFQQAGDQRAGEWLVYAGERATLAYAWVTAAARFEAALPLLGEDGPTTEARAWLLLRLAILLRYASPARAIAFVDQAARWATRAGDATVGAVATYYGGLLRFFAGELRRGVAESAAGVAAIEALPPNSDARLRTLTTPGRVRGTLAMWLAYVGRYAEAGAQAAHAVGDTAGPAGAIDSGASPHADGYLALLQTHAALGAPGAARRAYDRARDLYRAAGHLVNIGANARAAIGTLALPYHADDVAWRGHLADEADDAFLRAGESLPGYRPGLARVPLLLLAGDWSGAALIQQGGALPPWLHADLGALARARGDVADAWRSVRAILPDGPATEPGGAMYLRALEGQRLAAALALDAGDLPLARAWLAAHDCWLVWSGSVLGPAEGQLGWAAYHRAAGDDAAARDHAEAALAHATEPRQPLALLAAHRTLGMLHTEAERYIDAGAHLDAALALAEACAAPYERALILLALAELHLATGDRDAAHAAIAEARAILEPLEARPALARAEALAIRLAAPSPPAAPAAHPFGLTAREVEVLRLLAEGLTDRQVAARLFLTRNTVSTHLKAIYGKLGVTSRAAATRLALDHRLA